MTYATPERAFCDADSHIMELPNFLIEYADPNIRDQIPPVSYSASLVTDEEVEEIITNGGQHTTEHVEAQIALGDQPIASSKEIQALGAFDRGDRSTAMDMLGFRKQLVFATHSVSTPFSASRKLADDVRYGATRAHNRAMHDFCAEDKRWTNTGRTAVRDWMGGGENVRSKDMAVLHQGPETFISIMLTRLDWVARSWSKVDQYLAELQRTPSETLRDQMAFTPYVFEDIGSLTDQSYDDIYLFSSDYPHVEGGRDPIGRFESSLGARSETVRENFYAENFLKIFPEARAHDSAAA